MRNRINHWVIADTHFGHNRLSSLGHRPDDYNEQLLANLSMIEKNDVVYHLGDLSFYNHRLWSDRWFDNCRARTNILILGNHDNQTYSWYYDRGWDVVCHSLTLNIFGLHIILTHVPLIMNKNNKFETNTLNVHGHVHNPNHQNALLTDRHLAVVMEHNYRPILLKELVRM